MLFDEARHEYWENGIKFTSVSEFLSQFKPEFQSNLIARQSAKKYNTTPEKLLAKWDLNAKVSCSYGDAIHGAVEYWNRYAEVPKAKHLALAVSKFSKKYDRKKLKPEIIVKREDVRVAGTIDVLELLGEKRVNVIDIKTNGDLHKKPQGKFLPPLQDLPFSKLNEYRLQLSAYKEMLEWKGFTVEKLYLEHWNGKAFETIEIEPINLTELWKRNTNSHR